MKRVLLFCWVFAFSLAQGVTAQAAPPKDKVQTVQVDVSTFGCIQDLTPVRGFFVANLMGDLDATLQVANSAKGGVYPPGSLVQLVPSEVMVKREPGFSPATQDWEFFELAVSDAGTQIVSRGTTQVVNRFGGNCLACHAKAEPQWDLICEQGHGCDPLPLTVTMIKAIQKTDPRCTPQALSNEEITALKALKAALGGANSEKK